MCSSDLLWVVKQDSFSTVVWTPWADKIGTMPDLDPQEWPRFICVETANVADHAVTLAPGQSHVMRAVVQAG